MDRRGWLWKKKSSDKTDKAAVASEAAAGSRGEQVLSCCPYHLSHYLLNCM